MYEILAPYYEELFPASEASIGFLSRFCRERGRLLDVACGTGEHARKLASRGFEVTGVDLDGRMVELASERSTAATFRVADMTDLASAVGDLAPFDLVYCIGNSVVHLNDRTAISAFLRSSAELLAPGGRIALQIINFESLHAGRVPDLQPLSSGDGRISFSRRYEVTGPGHVDFITSLTVDGAKIHDDSLPLVVVTRVELEGLLTGAGFGDPAAYGGFDGKPWRTDSFVTIVEASRP